MDGIRCEVVEGPINVARALAFIRDDGHGAQLVFTGAVRGRNAGRDVVAVEYDAAAPLAVDALRVIAREAQERWGRSLRIIVVHRTGKLAVGEISVLIGVSAPHRDEAYQASRFVIEELKVRVPIWKKEYYRDGETTWLKGHALCQGGHDLA